MLKAWVPDIESATCGTREMTGLTTATLTQQTSLPPDSFLDDTVRASRSVAFKDPFFAPNTPFPASFLLPLSHVQPPTLRSDESGQVVSKAGKWL
eukprot:CAMPEP_0171783710 /NCGR_PEP_ID=MMETSP0991-20121206/61649_1 /TAXON_ID=483369 /ORGANISM="non described non described, Strain CCMP2098" /LENGTH=94 /DNA_ID=CAMNT_0012391887 /DNA_START=29 /DNA_END=310 /DNA_ORIENTATION=-